MLRQALAGGLLRRAEATGPAIRAHTLLARQYAVRFDADQQEVEDTLESNLGSSKDNPTSTVAPLTVKREAISLYRDIIRYSRLFVWKDDKGREWGEVLRKSARQEFEASQFETDPEMINRMLLMGRESVEEVKSKFLKKRQRIIDEEANLPPEQRGGPGGGSFN